MITMQIKKINNRKDRTNNDRTKQRIHISTDL